MQDRDIGDLLVICKVGDSSYNAFVLQSDNDIDEFFATLNISSVNTNGIIPKQFELTAEEKLQECFYAFIKALQVDFPATIELAARARHCYNNAHNITQQIIKANPNKGILSWLDAEFQLFKALENSRYSERIKTTFASVEELVEAANTILNRRKSRAGKSLEHHLTEIFTCFDLKFSAQVVTEGNKKTGFSISEHGSLS